jgi:hypothetical protein
MTMPSKLRLTALVATLPLLPAAASAQLLAGWDFTSGTGTAASISPTIVAPTLATVSAISRGSGLDVPGDTGGGWNFRNVNAALGSFSTALSGNDFVTFTVTPLVPSLTITNFSFNARTRGDDVDPGAALVGNTLQMALFSSADSYATALGTSGIIQQDNDLVTAGNQQLLTSMPMSLTITSATTFRLAITSNGTTAGNFFVGWFGPESVAAPGTYDMSLSAIPEPSSYALAGGILALGALVLARRRRA